VAGDPVDEQVINLEEKSIRPPFNAVDVPVDGIGFSKGT